MKNILQKILKVIAGLYLKRFRPKVVGVTGSVGKTSTKEAIYLVLSKKFDTRRNIGNYNNEIGIPLTIIGEKSAGNSIFGWLVIFVRSLIKLSYVKYPEYLVLEMGIDRPGDMDYLLSIVKPDMSVVTTISEIPAHLEYFETPDQLADEKFKLVKALDKENFAIINYDNKVSNKRIKDIHSRIITFGFDQDADLKAINLVLDSMELRDGQNVGGFTFKLQYQNNTVPVRLPYIVGQHQIYSALTGIACGVAAGMNLVEAAGGISELKPPKGRLNVLPGIKNTIIIDDTYNSAPDSAIAALNVLEQIHHVGRKIAVLGDMKELGEKTEDGHRQVGTIIPDIANLLVVVGDAAKFIADEAIKNGMEHEDIFYFDNSTDAGLFIQNQLLYEGDLLLIKGSQSMRMEMITKELMAEPLKASELLVRQDEAWLK